MTGYIQNNWDMICFFQNCYRGCFDSSAIFDKLQSLDIGNLFRFRVFLDSTVMMFNKEKLEKEYFKKNFQYIDFANAIFEFDISEYYKRIRKVIDESPKNTIFENINFSDDNFKDNPIAIFANLDNKNTESDDSIIAEPIVAKFFDQVSRLRNSFAHMQYGCFVHDEIGYMYYYGIYNKDKGIKRNCGIAFERIIHKFVERFYSNQATYGIPYKHSFFGHFDSNRNYSEDLFFYEIKYKFDADIKYNASKKQHPMIEYIKHQDSYITIFDFLDKDSNFIIKSEKVEDNILKLIKSFKVEGKILNAGAIGWFLKLLFDFETEFSNFMLHLRIVVDTIIEYNSHLKTGIITKEFESDCKKRIDELKEDEDDIVAFNNLFSVLKLYDIMIRAEDDDLRPLSTEFIDSSKFQYNSKDFVDWRKEYYQSNNVKSDDKVELPRKFILTKIRNAVAHGNIKLTLDSTGLNINLRDKFNNRCVDITVNIDDFEEMCEKIQL